MNWYLAKVVYRIVCGEGIHAPQFDEQLRLIQAENDEHAWEKALILGKNEEEVFVNEHQVLVQWQFVNIAELSPIVNFTDGIELYSRIEEPENADNYIAFTNRKADNIRESISRKVPADI
jgi:hypothetical protein